MLEKNVLELKTENEKCKPNNVTQQRPRAENVPVSQLEKKLRESEAKNKRLESEVDSKSKLLSELGCSTKRLETLNNSIKQENNTKQARIETLQKTLSSDKISHELYQEKIRKQCHTISELQSHITKQDAEIKELGSKLGDMEENHKSIQTKLTQQEKFNFVVRSSI